MRLLAMTTTPLPPLRSSLAFHRLALLGQPVRWWRPALVLLTALALYAALLIMPILALVVIAGIYPMAEPTLDQVLSIDGFDNPVGLAGGLVMIAVMLPAATLAVRLVGRRSAGSLLSVTGRLRWRLLARSAAVTAAVMAVFTGVALLLEPPTEAVPPGAVGRLALMLVIVLLVVPWQAAAEEIVFRGLLAQTVGSWLRHPAWAILLPLPLFVLGHDYDVVGLLDVAVFAAVAGYLTWRTGGLEAAIGMHVVNNLGAFVLALLTGADLNATEATLPATLVSIAYTLVTAALILSLAGCSPLAMPGADRPQFTQLLGRTEGKELLAVRFTPPHDDADEHSNLHDR